jgi:hypothetical protein
VTPQPTPAVTPVAYLGAVTLTLFILTAGALSAYHLLPVAASDFRLLKARWLVNEWRQGNGSIPTTAAWGQVRDTLERELASTPDSPTLLDDLGFLYASRAQTLSEIPALIELQQALLADAVNYYRAASNVRPGFPYTWAYLALAKHLLNQHDAELWDAFDTAMKHGRNEFGVQPVLAEIAFANWATLSPERRQTVIAMVADTPDNWQKRHEKLLAIAEKYVVTLNLEAPTPAPGPAVTTP